MSRNGHHKKAQFQNNPFFGSSLLLPQWTIFSKKRGFFTVTLHQKCPYFFDLVKWFRKNPDPPILLNKYEDRGFFWTIWSNQKSKDIFDAKMAYGQQHFLLWFFAPVAPSHTSFSESGLSVTWSFIWKKLQIAISPKNAVKTFWFLHML